MDIMMSIMKLIFTLVFIIILTFAGISCTQQNVITTTVNQTSDLEIRSAPIDEVRVSILKSNPPQISVYIKGGLPDGCTSFHDIETTRNGSTVDIKVTIQRPVGVSCPAIYTNFEQYVNLGIDFNFGTTYTLNVNDYSTTFEGTLMKTSTNSTETLPHSFKGYELYSWLNNDQWSFTLITGTNRNKTIEEITSGENSVTETGWVKIRVTGVDAIKDVLSKLPEGESIFWCDELHIGYTAETKMELPPGEIAENIKEHAEQCKLDFAITFQ
jgi:hypothetical protein